MTRFLLISEEFLRSHLLPSTEPNGTSLSAHEAQVAPSGRPLGGANFVICIDAHGAYLVLAPLRAPPLRGHIVICIF
jgi:hypothetical protein